MSNKIKDIYIKAIYTTFSIMLSLKITLMKIRLKQMKSHTRTKIFLFTKLDMWRLKIQNT